jgi:adenine C2-methylase RlmN of 23S rRNA A2503 and tRNA A37
MLKNIYQVHPDILSAEIAKEFKSYRAKQVLDWLYKKFIYDPLDMSKSSERAQRLADQALRFKPP